MASSQKEMEAFMNDYDTEFSDRHHSEIVALSSDEKQVMNHILLDKRYHHYLTKYPVEIKRQSIKNLSDYVRHNYGKVVKLLVPEEFIDDFYYMTDNFVKYQYSESYYRRSFRSSDYYPFVVRVFDLIYKYYVLGAVGYNASNIKDFVLGSEEGLKHDVLNRYGTEADSYIIAARIDAGDTEVIDVIKEMITSENNTAILTYTVIRAVIQSSNSELHDLLCKLLVAARLSEGLRQAICENADCGTNEVFFKLMKTIKENNLVRFPSIKRSLGTWTGLCRNEDPDRLAGKILDYMVYVLESREHALEYIDTTDAVHIYMGLWGLGFYDVFDAVGVILNLVGIQKAKKLGFSEMVAALLNKKENLSHKSANRIQLLTIGYFCQNLDMDNITYLVSTTVFESYPEDYQLFSMFKNLYIYNLYGYNRRRSYKSFKSVEMFHDDRKLAAKHFDMLMNLYNSMPKKKMEYEKILFPWFSSSISKSELLCCMLDTARVLDDDEKIDFICEHLTEIDVGFRSNALEFICEKIKTPNQREVLVNAAADKESSTRCKAVKMLSEMKLTDEDYITLEGFTKYKKADLREGVLDLIKKRDGRGLNSSIIRMLPSKDENVRLAALDLLSYAIGEYKDFDFTEAKEAVSAIESPTEREEILINELVGTSAAAEVTAENGYGLYDPKSELPLLDFKPDPSVVRSFFSVTKNEITEMYLALMKLIDDNANLEYKSSNGEERLLGTFSGWFSWYREIPGKKLYESIPLHELWAQYYRDTVKTPQRLWAMCIRRKSIGPSRLTLKAQKLFDKNQELLFGEIVSYDYDKELVTKDERFDNPYFHNLTTAVLDSIISEFDLQIPYEVALNAVGYVAKEFSEEELWLECSCSENRSWEDKKYNFLASGRINFLFSKLLGYLDEDFETNFRILYELANKNRAWDHYLNGDIYSPYYSDTSNISVVYYVRAYMLGVISEDILYKSIFEIYGLQNAVQKLNPFLSRDAKRSVNLFKSILAQEGKDLDEDGMIPADSDFYKAGNFAASKLIDKILDVELKRGDSETVFSKSIVNIDHIYGMNRLMEILRAYGNESFSRLSSYWRYYSGNVSKKDSLSHLLNVCYPAADENAETLAGYIKNSKIKNDRLIEVAMFAPQWIDIIEDYLKLDGLKSGCYYFMAHTAESISDKRQAIIAKYTPLTKDELNGGCFDVKWFNEAYGILGDKMFNKLYKSAKYISSSNMHTRARKFADAALGKMDIAETEATIEDKRNKDLLMSLAIIPSEGKDDILQRYEFIQKFLKESKQFGAQRRASESSAVQYALKNLAVTAGYSDETTLTLSMETELVESNKQYFSWQKIGDYDVMIDIDKNGKPSMKFEKNGKALKSAPAAIKKSEEFLAVKEFNDKLKQQYSRTVKMLELAMEERDAFGFGELVMLCKNPVTKAIVENLVFVSAADDKFVNGLVLDGSIYDCSGNEKKPDSGYLLRVAHPYDLYEHKVWADYQQLFLERGEKEGKKQPFRQVFRELYVKLSEELEKERSLIFAGNQIQTSRTVGALRNRRWVADYEDGLQKVYYKDDIIAGIYAVADWFSPSDIEAPTLEGVTFVNRRTYAPLKIKDLPGIVYSEVMRDVDLAVSVAHAGGVDPETSHSTVEMRKVILEFNLKLFGIKNVTLEKNHAVIEGKYGKYSIHLGSGVIHKFGGHQINVIAVSSGKKSKLFLPFIDEDPKTAEIMTKVLTFAQDDKIKDPYIMEQIR